MSTARPDDAIVVIPVKSFDLAKGRLADHLDPDERSRLAQAMATRVIIACAPLPAWVICDDADVAALAIEAGANVLWRSSRGLNAAVRDGFEFARAEGVASVIIAHADLPLATTLAWVADFDGVTIVQDRRGDGTNVMCLPTSSPFSFRYGPGSAAAHQREAVEQGLPVRVVDDPELGWDIDVPEDLSAFDAWGELGVTP